MERGFGSYENEAWCLDSFASYEPMNRRRRARRAQVDFVDEPLPDAPEVCGNRNALLKRHIEDDEQKLRDETDSYRHTCKRVKTSLASKAADYLDILKAERRDVDKEIEEIQHVAERTRDRRQEEQSASDWECQMCFRRWGPDMRQAALSCGHAIYCRSCLETYFTTPAARQTRAGEQSDDGDNQEDAYRCPLGCDIGRNTALLELFL